MSKGQDRVRACLVGLYFWTLLDYFPLTGEDLVAIMTIMAVCSRWSWSYHDTGWQSHISEPGDIMMFTGQRFTANVSPDTPQAYGIIS
jgi:hypothetical protein